MRLILAVEKGVKVYELNEVAVGIGGVPDGWELRLISYHRDGLTSVNNGDSANPSYVLTWVNPENDKQVIYEVIKDASISRIIYVVRKKEELEDSEVEVSRE
jgi:hypothetical protein